MHPDEFDIDEALVRRLLVAQFPQWAELPLVPVASAGTDNKLYRLGDDMVVRLPRIEGVEAAIEKERRWLPLLAPCLPVSIPLPLAVGEPAETYPWHWCIYRWLDGENPSVDVAADHDHLTRDLARFLDALQQVDATEGPSSRRAGSLQVQDAEVQAALADVSALTDTDTAAAAWQHALEAPEWSRASVWVHGDLLPGNLLVNDGRLSGVIDWALMGVGDPACDLVAAWALLSRSARRAFRQQLDVDDSTWERGRGWALSIGLIALPYYKETNPGFASVAQRLIDATLTEYELEP